jgi:hypothetical protein
VRVARAGEAVASSAWLIWLLWLGYSKSVSECGPMRKAPATDALRSWTVMHAAHVR